MSKRLIPMSLSEANIGDSWITRVVPTLCDTHQPNTHAFLREGISKKMLFFANGNPWLCQWNHLGCIVTFTCLLKRHDDTFIPALKDFLSRLGSGIVVRYHRTTDSLTVIFYEYRYV